MQIWLTVGGALVGARALRLPGLFLGAGLGWGLGILLDLRTRVEQLEEAGRHPAPLPRPKGAAADRPAAGIGERYPEQTIIDAMREAGGEEMADLQDEVTGRRGNGSGRGKE